MSKHKKDKAVALKYTPDSDVAPIIVASGYGNQAKRIMEIAEEQGIPIFRDDSTASLLCMLDVGSSIPPELYQVIAAVYCNVLEISRQITQQNNLKEE